jgi:hypothetical protein
MQYLFEKHAALFRNSCKAFSEERQGFAGRALYLLAARMEEEDEPWGAFLAGRRNFRTFAPDYLFTKLHEDI